MDAAGGAPNTRATLDRAKSARPTSVHTHYFRNLTAAQNIEGGFAADTKARRRAFTLFFVPRASS